MNVAEIRELYENLKPEIDARIREFTGIRERGNEKETFSELAFCILTPQSKAKTCWKAVECMKERGILFSGTEQDITDCLVGVRFKYTKAERVLKIEKKFPDGRGIKMILDGFKDPFDIREWLVKNIDGYGYKEASHFLRNTGYGLELAILDRHILRNLESAGVISEIPKTLTRRAYLDIEERMLAFSEKIGVPMPALDLIFWYEGAGEIFK